MDWGCMYGPCARDPFYVNRTNTCYALNKDENGTSKWIFYNRFSEYIQYYDLNQPYQPYNHSITSASVFLPKYGTYIFGYDKSQFLPIGYEVEQTTWRRGTKDTI